ncbi:MAG: esterase family protein [Candidatus Sumerlaeia bacterium]|nr:esterase family protein [Candidatus Sumerlaeia bacterium]
MSFIPPVLPILVGSLLYSSYWLVEGSGGSDVEPIAWITEEANTELATREIFPSDSINGEVSFHIYLPPVYHDDPDRRFPVIYWLHGSGNGVLGVPPMSNQFHSAISNGLVPPIIIVFPNGLEQGMWCDSKDGRTPMESILINDLIPYVDGNFRTIPERHGRLIEGFSMGGYGAGRIGLKHYDLFHGFSMLGAGPLQLDFLEEDPNLIPMESRLLIFETVYGNDMDYYLEQHPKTLAEKNAGLLPADHAMRVIVGSNDRLLENNRLLRNHFDSLEIPHEYREIEGVAHQPLATFTGIGPANWLHYRSLFGGEDD